LIRKTKILRNRSFTLIEIVVCLAIIASLGAALCWNVYGAMRHHRFDESVKKVRNEIEALQMFSLTFGSDMELKFEKREGGWRVVPVIYEAALRRMHVKPFDLSGVDRLRWGASENDFTLKIYASGRFEPKGVLEMSQGERKFYIDLQNPLSVILTKEPPKPKWFRPPKKPESQLQNPPPPKNR